MPTDPEPLRPLLSVLFSHAVAPAVYASDAALSAYVFLTSLTDPGAPNVVRFTDVSYDPLRNRLTFAPAAPLSPGQTYQATVRGTLPDAAGRLLGQSYCWEFDADPGQYRALPVPLPQTPPDGTAVAAAPFTLTWGLDAAYAPPPGLSLSFLVRLCADREGTDVVWTGMVPAPPDAASGSALALASVSPVVPGGQLPTPQVYYWTVASALTDTAGAVQASSPPSAPAAFLLSVPSDPSREGDFGGPGAASAPELRQRDPLIPAQAPRVVAVWPPRGWVVQDTAPPL